MRSDRKRDLLRILHSGKASSQKDIVDALRAAGHEVTQATVSRDLREVGAAKLRSGEDFVYLLPDELGRTHGSDLMIRNLERTLEEFSLDVRTAHSLVVVLTAPGHGSAVARAIDLAGLDEVAGTVAGDDTIFVATPSPDQAVTLAARWSGNDREEES
ncbi:MAG: arginine repressor [Actinobacteria bacterium]|nr:arginine repressor [Actinomycetota bacterium]